ncbi:hypothetical protein [Propioniciclava soli]|uniref:hypothetical protein n=1 Tax=Propioniciclava soli TaxID=2775081 RepID=UPI001E44036D|nr:hypothetical protein [Propioniciclava soli]
MNELMQGDRLPTDMVRLIEHVISPLAESSSKLLEQAEDATVVRYSATMLDVEVPPGIPAVDLPDGPTPVEALVYDGDQLVGELLVWLRAGRLFGLEQAWYTDSPPTSWPPPDRVVVR